LRRIDGLSYGGGGGGGGRAGSPILSPGPRRIELTGS
jgi:hypothetical protein